MCWVIVSAAGYHATGVIQAVCCWVMGIAFLLNNYQIVTHVQYGGAGIVVSIGIVFLLQNGIFQVLVSM